MATSIDYEECTLDVKRKEFKTQAIDAFIDKKVFASMYLSGDSKILVYQAFPSLYRKVKGDSYGVIVVLPLR